MTEARREIDPAQLSPSNGRDTRRGFLQQERPLPYTVIKSLIKEKAFPPTKEDAQAANNGAYAGSTRTAEKIGGNKTLRTLVTLGEVLGIAGASAGVGYGVFRAASAAPFFREASSDFTEHLNKDKPLSIPVVPAEAKKVDPDEIFDNAKDDMRSGPTNAVQMSVEEYLKIAPPTIEKDSVNIPITIVSKDGHIRTLNIKRGAGMLGGERRICKAGKVCTEDNIKETLFTKNTIVLSGLKVGDEFKSPINGIIYHSSGPKNPDGTLERAGYFMDGHDENGNKIHLLISTVAIRQIMQTPNDDDYTEKVQTTVKRPDGTEFTTNSYRIANEKIPEVKANIGNGLFEILTDSEHKFFPGQIKIEVSTEVTEDGVYRGGGARINISTLDNKAIVLK